MADKKDNQHVRKDVRDMSFMSDTDRLQLGPRSLVEQDRGFLTDFLQVEKLVAALFLITTQDSTDPAREELRRISLRFLDEAVTLLVDAALNSGLRFARWRAHGYRLLSLLKIAEAAGLVSEMNGGVLREAITACLKRVAERLSRTLSLASLEVSEPDQLAEFPSIAIKDTMIKDISMPEAPKPARRATKSGVRSGVPAEVRASRHSDRETTIAGLIRERGVVSVKDVASVIRGVSEKTLQRELLSMVAKGVLRKEGERRWSKYSLTGATPSQTTA